MLKVYMRQTLSYFLKAKEKKRYYTETLFYLKLNNCNFNIK